MWFIRIKSKAQYRKFKQAVKALKSIDKFTDEKIRKINLALAERPLRSLDGHSPKEAFINVFSHELFEGMSNIKRNKN